MQAPEESNEIVRLKVGAPSILSAEIPIRSSVFGPLVGWFRRAPHEQLIHILGRRAIVHVNDDDAGTLDFYLDFVNMTDRRVQVGQLYLEHFWIAGYTSHIAQPLFTPPADPTPPDSVTEIILTIPLGPASIRDLLHRIQKGSNAYSSARVEVTVGGRLAVTVEGRLTALQGRRQVNLPFKVAVRQPELNFSNPGSRS